MLPYLISSGTLALLTAISLAALALVAVRVGIGWLTGRSVVKAAIRQLVVGTLAAGATYGIGRLIGGSPQPRRAHSSGSELRRRNESRMAIPP